MLSIQPKLYWHSFIDEDKAYEGDKSVQRVLEMLEQNQSNKQSQPPSKGPSKALSKALSKENTSSIILHKSAQNLPTSSTVSQNESIVTVKHLKGDLIRD